ncbi:paraquat-inducible protein A [Teredinibacter sp. KSP-S5-2]|uniref:paraquat-inducible protein A n=1 Tax=Teredinibacter sp. KSP-S5-2 TaxID=3034506 RepID=UPI002934906A|nr:paraquat-inducible protein A [Teredinibacter sp. KSP-S5-2]WNO08834.1 paraquat-inducible protein A [Teredinibacter sp. KSP-S5-2]
MQRKSTSTTPSPNAVVFADPEAEVFAVNKNWLLCHSCGELQKVVAISAESEMICCNCNSVLHIGRSKWLGWGLSLAVTSLVLFFLSNAFPFMTLEVGSQSQTATILDGFWALFDRNQWLLASLVLTTVFLFPLFEIFSFLYLLIPYNLNKKVPGQRIILRWLTQAQDWSMLEVFLLGMLVASVKLNDMAILHFEKGAYAFFILVSVLILAYLKLDRRRLWSWIETNNYFCRDELEWVYDCQVCQAMVGKSIVESTGQCPRCHAEVHKRIPNSLQKTTALIIAATILYIPANILPIMTYSSLGVVETDTIFSGVVELITAELYWIAIVVFVASILVPIAKLVVLSYLVWSVHTKMKTGVRHRQFLYKLTEFVGRWSMVDVFVVTMLVAIVQFGFVYTVEPEPAIIAFGAVVVLTMVAAESFDPRLLWDALENEDTE